MPSTLLNERSGLTLLALTDLTPDKSWVEAATVLRGISEMMDFMAEKYDKRYAENTRESIRKDVVHHLVHGGVALLNPDDPQRPTNSGKTVYQVSSEFLSLVHTYGTLEWDAILRAFLIEFPALGQKYAAARKMNLISVKVRDGETIRLSAGGQNVLVEKIINRFCGFFTPGSEVVYVGDTSDKWAYLNEEILQEIGVRIEEHGKMPDVVVFLREKNWLVLIEAVTSHGPISQKRRSDLAEMFKGCSCGLVYVTAFLDKKTLLKYLLEIAWETEVWVAENETHIIHFNGERFLGPYDD